MKKTSTFFYLVATMLIVVGMSSFVGSEQNIQSKDTDLDRVLVMSSLMSKEELINITPSEFEAKTGYSLSFAEVLTLKKVKKMAMSSLSEASSKGSGSSDKSQGIAFLLSLLPAFIGLYGIHRFYIGKIGSGVVQVLTFGGCGIWWLVDLIRLSMNTLPDSNGNTLKSWFN